MTILIVDDHQLFRTALETLLSQGNFKDSNFFTVGSGKEAIEVIQSEPVDLVLLDVQMPRMNGYQTAETMLRYRPSLKIIMLTMVDTLTAMNHFFAIGVKGYLTKGSSSQELYLAIETVMQGRLYYPEEIFEGASKDEKGSSSAVKFSPQEMQVMLCLSKEVNSSQIAASMGLSKRTVESYRLQMIEKAFVKNTAELLNYFSENGLK